MTSSIKHIILLLLFIAQPIMVFGQSKVIVVTRKLEQKWDAKPGSKLIIKGEKAKIIIEQSNSAFIEVQLKLKAKHFKLEIAKRELQYLKYNLNKKGKEFYLNNDILLPVNVSQPEARLSAEYIIKVPDGCGISIENNLGDILLKDLNNNININIKYGNIFLNDIKGKIDVKIIIGDVKVTGLSGEAKIQSEYSEIRMENINGNCVLQTRYGNLEIVPGAGLKNLNIDSYKTDVHFINQQIQEYNLDIETQYGGVILSQPNYIKTESILEKTIQKGKITDLKYKKSETLPEITINSKFADVNLR